MTTASESPATKKTTTKTTTKETFIKNGIEVFVLSDDDMGSHAEHWQALTPNAETDVPQWLGNMLDEAIVPMGLSTKDHLETQSHLLLATEDPVHPCQVIELDAEQKPSHLVAAFPSVNSPYDVTARIERILTNPEQNQAVLRLALPDGTTIYAFDTLYSVNADMYNDKCLYKVNISGLAHEVTHAQDDETLTVTDPEAIRHHRALNDILAANDGVAPDDLQEQLAAWQPQSDDDKLPVTLSMSNMCAYLYGEHLGQEDEAWCQGEVLGLQNVTISSQALYLLDVAVLREEDTQPVVVRIAVHTQNAPENLQVGDFIRTNLWFQAKIHTVSMNNS